MDPRQTFGMLKVLQFQLSSFHVKEKISKQLLKPSLIIFITAVKLCTRCAKVGLASPVSLHVHIRCQQAWFSQGASHFNTQVLLSANFVHFQVGHLKIC